MRTSRTVLLFLFLLLAAQLSAQDSLTTEKRHRYFNLFQSGGLFGKKDQGTSFTFSTFHGVQFNTVRVGLGTGYDNYQRWRILPLYVMASVDLAQIRSNSLYLMLSGGFGKAWYQKQMEYDPEYEADRAFTLSPALGYRIIADKWNINFNVGYKLQRIDYSYNYEFWYDSRYPAPTHSVEEVTQRLVVQIGFGLN